MNKMPATFGEWFEDHLIRMGKSQMDAADQIGVGQSTVSAWINNRTLPRRRMLKAIAEYLGVPIDDVMQRVGMSPARSNVQIASRGTDAADDAELYVVENDPLRDPRLRLWAAVEGELPEQDKEFLRRMARMMLEDQKRDAGGDDGLSH